MRHTWTWFGVSIVLTAFSLAGIATNASAAAPTLSVAPTQGNVDTPATLEGGGFSPGASVELVWQTMEGNRVSGSGYQEIFWPLGTVTADATGAIRFPFKVPFDLGGPSHRIEARLGKDVAATTNYTILRTAKIAPTSGPVGTTIELHMTGGGWTQFDNIVAVTYDNVFMGFQCSFNSQGNMTIWLPAAGKPGLHTIDVWPALYWGPDSGPTPWKIAHLSDGDQPTKIPKYHFEFMITEGPSVAALVAKDDSMPVSDAPPSAAAVLAQLKNVKEPTLALSADLLPTGHDFIVAGAGFAPGAAVKLEWKTVTVKTETKGDKNRGWNATPASRDLGTAVADAAGTFAAMLKVPEDFGGMHDIHAFVGDQKLAQTALQVKPRFEFLGPSVVKAGEKVTVGGYGLGYEKYTAVWSVLYDNQLHGWVSAFETQGKLTFDVYAVGEPGRHFIDVHEGSNGWPYLNLWESPWPWEPPAHFSFEIAPDVATVKSTDVSVVKASEGIVKADDGAKGTEGGAEAAKATDDAHADVPASPVALLAGLVIAVLVWRGRRRAM